MTATITVPTGEAPTERRDAITVTVTITEDAGAVAA
jgi:hypothetical protein